MLLERVLVRPEQKNRTALDLLRMRQGRIAGDLVRHQATELRNAE